MFFLGGDMKHKEFLERGWEVLTHGSIPFDENDDDDVRRKFQALETVRAYGEARRDEGFVEIEVSAERRNGHLCLWAYGLRSEKLTELSYVA
jgi:hypothetical protein